MILLRSASDRLIGVADSIRSNSDTEVELREVAMFMEGDAICIDQIEMFPHDYKFPNNFKWLFFVDVEVVPEAIWKEDGRVFYEMIVAKRRELR